MLVFLFSLLFIMNMCAKLPNYKTSFGQSVNLLFYLYCVWLVYLFVKNLRSLNCLVELQIWNGHHEFYFVTKVLSQFLESPLFVCHLLQLYCAGVLLFPWHFLGACIHINSDLWVYIPYPLWLSFNSTNVWSKSLVHYTFIPACRKGRK